MKSLHEAISECKSADQNSISCNSRPGIQLDSVVFFLDNVFLSAFPDGSRQPKPEIQTPRTNELIGMAASLILDYETSNLFVKRHQLEALKSLFYYLSLNQEALKKAIAVATQASQFIPENESIYVLSTETVETRRKAFSLLIRLASSIPDSLLVCILL